jgi:hypothetical protein
MMTKHMLTTTDNPFDPFTQFDDWNAYDERMGYYSMNFLARVIRTSNELSDYDQDLAYEQAIQEIVEENVLGIYKKVAEREQKV